MGTTQKNKSDSSAEYEISTLPLPTQEEKRSRKEQGHLEWNSSTHLRYNRSQNSGTCLVTLIDIVCSSCFDMYI